MAKKILLAQVKGEGWTHRRLREWIRAGLIKADKVRGVWLVYVHEDNTPVIMEQEVSDGKH